MKRDVLNVVCVNGQYVKLDRRVSKGGTRMKKVICIAVILLLVSFGLAFALADNTNKQGQIGINEQDQDQLQGQKQGQLQDQAQAAIAAQGQQQGQVSVGAVNTEVKGDNIDTTAISFPSVSAAEGTSSASATYLFGSLGKASTETYKRIIPQIQAILAIPQEVMGTQEKGQLINILTEKMMGSNRTQRFLGFAWEDNSKSLLNFFGLLTWDSVWMEGQKPFQCKADIK